MKIVADENIPLVGEFFDDLGEVIKLPGRQIKQQDLVDADVLLIRSVTSVNKSLLQHTSVKYVGTCTIGLDHIDTQYLQEQGIGFSNAPGCNAEAVVNYVVSVLIALAEVKICDWHAMSVGVVGAGNVGGSLIELLRASGFTVVAYDPFVEEYSAPELAEQVWQQDVVTLHTPLTHSGEYATFHLVDANKLASMKADACFINAARGAVVDNDALKQHLQKQSQFSAVLDVWENEPNINLELLKRCLIATPHIAGYSLDGKLNGTAVVYKKLCEFLGLPIRKKLPQLTPEAPIRKLTLSVESSVEFAIKKAVRSMYDVRDDHFRMQRLLHLDETALGDGFDQLRKSYPLRRDFTCLNVALSSSAVSQSLEQLGFKVKSK